VYFGGPPGRYVKFDGIEVKLEKPGFSFAGAVSMLSGADPDVSPIHPIASSAVM